MKLIDDVSVVLTGEIWNVVILGDAPDAMATGAFRDDALELRLIDSKDWRAHRHDEESADEMRTKFEDHLDLSLVSYPSKVRDDRITSA